MLFSGKQFLLDPEIDHGDKLHAQNTGDELKDCQLKEEATKTDPFKMIIFVQMPRFTMSRVRRKIQSAH